MTMHAYSLWTERAAVQGNLPPLATLSFHPQGLYQGDFQLMFKSATPIEEQLRIADLVLAEVQRWRDGIAEYADRQRTAVDELTEAKAEIERLKTLAEAGDLDAA